MIKFLVKNNKQLDVVFQEVLIEMIGASIKRMTDDTILEKLLLMKDFPIFYNNKNIVKRALM